MNDKHNLGNSWENEILESNITSAPGDAESTDTTHRQATAVVKIESNKPLI